MLWNIIWYSVSYYTALNFKKLYHYHIKLQPQNDNEQQQTIQSIVQEPSSITFKGEAYRKWKVDTYGAWKIM